MGKVRVLAARAGLRVPIFDAQGHPLRGAQGAISVTSEGLLFEHSGQTRQGPVEVEDSLYLRTILADGDLVVVPEAPPASAKPARGAGRE